MLECVVFLRKILRSVRYLVANDLQGATRWRLRGASAAEMHIVWGQGVFFGLCALCIAQIVHCAFNRFCTVPLLIAQVMQCNYSVDCAENAYIMLHWFGWSMK